MTALPLITTAAGLVDVAAALDTAAWVALDTESNSMFVYKEQVCLLQLNVAGALFVVDPLSLGVVAGQPSKALDVLKPGLERKDRPLYLHGGEYDVACMKRDFGIALGGVFDTQQAASLLGWTKTGYGSVVEQVCGVVLGKAWATYDWATRPLNPEALAYAIDDVVYLPKAAEHLRDAVVAADIVDEVAVANGVVSAYDWTGGFDKNGFWKLRDIDSLTQPSLKVLARVFAWRDAAAAAEGQPAGRLINNEVLLLLARHPPTTMADLKKARVKSSIAAVHGDALLTAVALADSDPAPTPPASHTRPPAMVLAREAKLKTWRREESERRTAVEGRPVPFQLVLPARALDWLKVHGADDLDVVPQLGTRRAARYGAAIRSLLA